MLMGVMSLTSRCAPTVLDQSDEVKLRIRLPRLNPALEALILSMKKEKTISIYSFVHRIKDTGVSSVMTGVEQPLLSLVAPFIQLSSSRLLNSTFKGNN